MCDSAPANQTHSHTDLLFRHRNLHFREEEVDRQWEILCYLASNLALFGDSSVKAAVLIKERKGRVRDFLLTSKNPLTDEQRTF